MGQELTPMPTLYLVPNSLTEENIRLLPVYIADEIKNVRTFFVEEPKSARRLLKQLNAQFPLQDCQFLELSEHSKPRQVKEYAHLLKSGDCAIISEAGCPCVADPGSDLVSLAHQYQINIIPLVGPSSILLALMASGLNGQNFAFNGYLPKDRQERLQTIKILEERSFKEQQTQVFMEAPYRNQHMLEDILACCHEQTLLCIASSISLPDQIIMTMSIKKWKDNPIAIDKKPTLFLLQKK